MPAIDANRNRSRSADKQVRKKKRVQNRSEWDHLIGPRLPLGLRSPTKRKRNVEEEQHREQQATTQRNQRVEATARDAPLGHNYAGDVKSDADRGVAEDHVRTAAYRKLLFLTRKERLDRALRTGEDLGPIKVRKAGLAPADTLHLRTVADKGVHSALWLAEKSARPSHAVMGGLDKALHGGSPADIVKEQVRGIFGKQHTSGSDVLKNLGVDNGAAKGIGGFVGDVLLDPLTYLTFGAGGVARKAGENASRAVIREGEKKVAQGATTREEVLQRAEHARAAAEKGKPTNKGLQIGVRVPFSGRELRTSGRTTARLNHALGGSHVATKIRDSHLADRTLPHIAPDFRRRGVSPSEHVARRRADRRLRAAAQRGRSKAAHHRKSIENAVTNDAERVQLTGAVEGAVKDMPSVTPKIVPTKAHEAKKAVKKAKRDVKTTTGNARTAERELRRRVLKGDDDVQHAISGLNKAVHERAVSRTKFGNEARAKGATKRDAEIPEVKTNLAEADAKVAAARARVQVMIAKAEDKPIPAKLAERPVGAPGTRPGPPLADRAVLAGADQSAASRRLADAEARKAKAGKAKARKEEALLTDTGKRWTDVRGPHERVTTPHTQVAAKIAAENARMAREEVARGILRPAQVKPNYMEHKHPEQVTPPRTEAGVERAVNARSGGFDPGKARKHDLPAAEMNAARAQHGRQPLFEEDAAKIQGHRALTHERRIARQDHADALAATGATVTRQAAKDLPRNYGIYRRSESDNWTRLTDREVRDIGDGAIKATDDLRILNNKNVAASLAQSQRAFERPNLYRRATGRIKGAQTVWNPSYYVGNEFGNQVFAWQADTTMKAWSQSHHAVNLLGKRNKFEQAADSAKDGVKFRDTLNAKDKDLLDLVEEGEKVGALSGHYMAEVRHLTESEPGRLRRLSEHRENQARLASYISARRDKGMNPEEASDWVNKHHIDYGDLSPMEQKLRDYGIPFYTFSARNARLQAEKVFQRPGKLATWEKAREDMAKAMGEDPEFAKSLRRYEQAGLPFVVHAFGHKVLFFPRSPIDLGLGLIPSSLDDVANGFGSRVNLIPKTAYELWQNQSTFFRSKIEDPQFGTDQVPAPAWAPFAAKFVPGLAGYTHLEKGENGKWFWRGKADYIVGLTPQTKFVSGLMTDKKPTQDLRSQNRVMNSLSFVGIKIGDHEASLDKSEAEELRKKVAKAVADKNHMKRNTVGGPATEGKGWIGPSGQRMAFASKKWDDLEAERKKYQDQLDALTGKAKQPTTTIVPRPLTVKQKRAEAKKKFEAKRDQKPTDRMRNLREKNRQAREILKKSR